MPTASGLESFTLYLDPEDPEDAPIIRYLKTKIRKKKVSSELRTAMLIYMEHLKGGNLSPLPRYSPPLPEYGPPRLAAPVPHEESGSKTLQEARRSFMKR